MMVNLDIICFQCIEANIDDILISIIVFFPTPFSNT